MLKALCTLLVAGRNETVPMQGHSCDSRVIPVLMGRGNFCVITHFAYSKSTH